MSPHCTLHSTAADRPSGVCRPPCSKHVRVIAWCLVCVSPSGSITRLPASNRRRSVCEEACHTVACARLARGGVCDNSTIPLTHTCDCGVMCGDHGSREGAQRRRVFSRFRTGGTWADCRARGACVPPAEASRHDTLVIGVVSGPSALCVPRGVGNGRTGTRADLFLTRAVCGAAAGPGPGMM